MKIRREDAIDKEMVKNPNTVSAGKGITDEGWLLPLPCPMQKSEEDVENGHMDGGTQGLTCMLLMRLRLIVLL